MSYELSKRGSGIESSSEQEQRDLNFEPGPIVLDLRQAVGVIQITVDPQATRARGTITASKRTGPAADAVRSTQVTAEGRRVGIRVPDVPGGGGTTIVNGNNVMVVNGSVTINGVRVNPPEPLIRTNVVMPSGSWLKLRTKSADVVLAGVLDSLDLDMASGNFRAEQVGELTMDGTSGSFYFGRITKKLDIRMTSGMLDVRHYEGSRGSVRMTSGSASIHATKNSSGEFSTRISSGVLTLTGSRHLDTRDRDRSSGVLNIS